MQNIFLFGHNFYLTIKLQIDKNKHKWLNNNTFLFDWQITKQIE